MKKLSALLAAAALVGAASAYAANPFSDVPTDSWAYQAVSQLAAEGVVVGYPDGTFGGEKNITRYEMAQIIARALAVEDRANAEQRAVINKLAQEFGSELNSLGVRVAGLENRIGNVKITGDARLRYKAENAEKTLFVEENGKIKEVEVNKDVLAKLNEWKEEADKLYKQAVKVRDSIADKKSPEYANAVLAVENNKAILDKANDTIKATKKSDAWDYRVRLNANAKVSENTNVNARFVLSSEFGKEKSSNVTFDRLNINHKFGAVNAIVGRQGLVIGDGLSYDDTVDGVVAATNVGPVNVAAGYVYPTALGDMKATDSTLTFGQLSADVFDGVNAKAYYAKASNFGDLKKVYGAALSGNVGPVKLNTEFVKSNLEKSNAWVVGGAYTYGPATLGVQYFHQDVNAAVLSSTYDQRYTQNWKGFVAGLEYAVAQNTTAKFVYAFKGNVVEKEASELAPAAKYYAQLVYKF